MKKPISVPFQMPESDDGKYIAVLCEDSILKTRREQLGLSQQQVADMAHIPLKQYQRLETGETGIVGTSFKIGLSVCTVLLLDPYSFLPADIEQPDPKTMKPVPMFHNDLPDDLFAPRRTGRKTAWKDIKTVFVNYMDYSLLIPYDVLYILGDIKFVQLSWNIPARRIVICAAEENDEGAIDVPVSKYEHELFALPSLIEKQNPIEAMGWGDIPHSLEARLVHDKSGKVYLMIDLKTAKPADTSQIDGFLTTPQCFKQL